MRWLIDGYNVTRRDPATRDSSLEEQRNALETRMRTHASKLLGTTDYQIIWDGAGGFATNAAKDAKASYTRMPTADDAIVERVRKARERIGVVTSDNGLASRCRGGALHGVDIRPSSDLFEQAVSKQRKKSKGKRMSRDVGIPAGANDINRELKELWGIE